MNALANTSSAADALFIAEDTHDLRAFRILHPTARVVVRGSQGVVGEKYTSIFLLDPKTTYDGDLWFESSVRDRLLPGGAIMVVSFASSSLHTFA